MITRRQRKAGRRTPSEEKVPVTTKRVARARVKKGRVPTPSPPKPPAERSSRGVSSLPASLRSSRPWRTVELAEFSKSSPQDVDLPRMLLVHDRAGTEFQREVEAALRRIMAGDGDGKAYLMRLAQAERARTVDLQAVGVRIEPLPAASGRGHLAYRVVEENGDRVQAALEAVYGGGKGPLRPSARVLQQAVAEAYRAVWGRLQDLTTGRAETVWRTAERRRSMPGPLTKRQRILVAEGRRQAGVLGVDPAFPYSMPKDLQRWLSGLGVCYDPSLNPRRRRRLRKGLRARWAFGYDFSLPKKIAELIVSAMSRSALPPAARAKLPLAVRARLPPAVSPSRGWRLLLPEVLVCQGPADVSAEQREARVDGAASTLRKMLDLARRRGRPVAAYAALFGSRTGHANAAVLELGKEPAQVNGKKKAAPAATLTLIDPHGRSIIGAHILSELGESLDRALAEEEANELRARPRGKVVAYTPSPVKAKALRVQYGIEGACGPSSLAVLLSALRQLRRGDTSPERILRGVRDQDMVLAIQLTHKA
jgi:hypothetical protein